MSRPDAASTQKTPLSFLGGLLLPVFVAALIFAEDTPLPGLGTVALALLVVALLGTPRTRRNLIQVLERGDARRLAGLIVPAMFLAGIFGGNVMMLAVLALAALALLLAAGQSAPLLAHGAHEGPLPATSPLPQLPAQAPGEVAPPIDVRDLCRGLPPTLAGQVLATVEHLENAAREARRSGDTRRTFDAQRSLDDYLPSTVTAWKAQPEAQRDPAELERALAQVQGIAGTDSPPGEAARQTWTTQQRFLEARSGTPADDQG